MATTTNDDNAAQTKVVVATRLHLGNASSPPETAKTEQQIAAFAKFVATSCPAGTQALIAVDATPKVEGYNYVAAVQAAVDIVLLGDTITTSPPPSIHVIPVTPWGRFVPALNALIAHATKTCQANRILFVSAETTASAASIQILLGAIHPDTLVAGARLGGHVYHESTTTHESIALTGRTSPWNTLAVWNLQKLALTGFQLVSDGLLTDDATEPSYGVEEVLAIALLQKVLGLDQAKAKLIKLPDIQWDQDFQDEERRQWHEQKMSSKVERANRQLILMGLTGAVYHC